MPHDALKLLVHVHLTVLDLLKDMKESLIEGQPPVRLLVVC